MISVVDADRLLALHTRALETVRVPLAEAAGRILREDVAAERDLPPFDRATMDGVALSSAAVAAGRHRFAVASRQRAGEVPHALPGPESCVEIATGAVLPYGADAVVPSEQIRLEAGMAEILGPEDVRAGQSIHRRGSDASAGTTLVRAGTRIGPTHVAGLASAGAAILRVGRRPRVAVVTTGDELAPVDGPVRPHQVRRSNGVAMQAALALHGFPDASLDHAPDDPERLGAALAQALAQADVVVTTGGVSVGRLDLVPDALARLGVGRVFHRVAQRPGRPLWFGVAGDGGPAVFGLPGNPVSALVGLVRYVVPLLGRMEGAAEAPPGHVRLEALPPRPPGLTLFLPVHLDGPTGRAVPTGGSGDVVSLLPTPGFAEVAPETLVPAEVPFHPWSPR